jgi:hypothetical protein
VNRLRPLVAILLSLLLLGAQEVAFAHMVGHIGSVGAVVTTVEGDDDGHGEALTLSHVCTTCVSASGLASAAPFGVPPPLTVDGVVAAPISTTMRAVAVAAPHRYSARAPPAVL